MTIRDVLKEGKPIKSIIVRINYSENAKVSDVDRSIGIFSGKCSWNGKELISDYGEYQLDEEIYKYSYESEDLLIIWIKTDYL